MGGLGVFDFPSRLETTFVDLGFGKTLSFTGKAGALAAGVEGTASEPLGDEGIEDGGDEPVGTTPLTTLVLVFIFLARVVRIFSSSSEEG